MKLSSPPTRILAWSASDARQPHDAPHAPRRREFVRLVALGAAASSAVGMTGCCVADDPASSAVASELKCSVISSDPLTGRPA